MVAINNTQSCQHTGAMFHCRRYSESAPQNTCRTGSIATSKSQTQTRVDWQCEVCREDATPGRRHAPTITHRQGPGLRQIKFDNPKNEWVISAGIDWNKFEWVRNGYTAVKVIKLIAFRTQHIGTTWYTCITAKFWLIVGKYFIANGEHHNHPWTHKTVSRCEVTLPKDE